jgi:L-ascorbate metabolism protein UlaG (beta-lactamase superfamily)
MLDTRGNRLTYLGHSTFTLTTKSGQVILIDPWVMGNPRCPQSLKKFARLDVILITHCHSDHCGDVLELARAHKPQIVAIYEACIWLESKGLEKTTRPMSKGGTQKVGEIEVTMTHAFHSSSIVDDGKVIYAGEAAGYIVKFPGGFSMYHAGDTAVFGDMKLIGELYKPDVACLPIGDLFTMGPREAACAIRLLGVKHVIPMHYATAPYLTGTPEQLRAETAGFADLQIHALQPGASLG